MADGSATVIPAVDAMATLMTPDVPFSSAAAAPVVSFEAPSPANAVPGSTIQPALLVPVSEPMALGGTLKLMSSISLDAPSATKSRMVGS